MNLILESSRYNNVITVHEAYESICKVTSNQGICLISKHEKVLDTSRKNIIIFGGYPYLKLSIDKNKTEGRKYKLRSARSKSSGETLTRNEGGSVTEYFEILKS